MGIQFLRTKVLFIKVLLSILISILVAIPTLALTESEANQIGNGLERRVKELFRKHCAEIQVRGQNQASSCAESEGLNLVLGSLKAQMKTYATEGHQNACKEEAQLQWLSDSDPTSELDTMVMHRRFHAPGIQQNQRDSSLPAFQSAQKLISKIHEQDVYSEKIRFGQSPENGFSSNNMCNDSAVTNASTNVEDRPNFFNSSQIKSDHYYCSKKYITYGGGNIIVKNASILIQVGQTTVYGKKEPVYAVINTSTQDGSFEADFHGENQLFSNNVGISVIVPGEERSTGFNSLVADVAPESKKFVEKRQEHLKEMLVDSMFAAVRRPFSEAAGDEARKFNCEEVESTTSLKLAEEKANAVWESAQDGADIVSDTIGAAWGWVTGSGSSGTE